MKPQTFIARFTLEEEIPPISIEAHDRYGINLIVVKVDDVTVGSINLRKNLPWNELLKKLVLLAQDAFTVTEDEK